jgi:hypothetical protein
MSSAIDNVISLQNRKHSKGRFVEVMEKKPLHNPGA